MATTNVPPQLDKLPPELKEKIQELRKLYAEGSEVGQRALEKLLGQLAAPRTDKPVTEIKTAGRTGLRQGKVSELTVIAPFAPGGAKRLRALLKLLVDKLRTAWPTVKITVRGDSGFCRWRLMRWCDSHGIGYVFGLAKNPVLERTAIDEIARAERQYKQTREPQRLFGSFSYAAKTWDRHRRVVVKAEHNAQGANPRFVVSNIPVDPQELYDDVYCQRGEMENRIKEQQLDLFADRTSCHRFLANQFRLLLSSAAYVLVQAVRRTALAGTDLARAQVGTIRLKLFKVAARVVVTVRRVVFHLASSYPYHEVFRAAYARLVTRQPTPALETS